VTATSSPQGNNTFTNTLDLSDLPDIGGATAGAEELRFAGLTPRESPVTLHSADVQITNEDGTTTLSAPIYGGYIVRCFALGYFTGSSEVIRFIQPRSPQDHAPVHSVTLRLSPRLRKVAVALADPRNDDPKKKIQRVGEVRLVHIHRPYPAILTIYYRNPLLAHRRKNSRAFRYFSYTQTLERSTTARRTPRVS
jgi:hypothetical protein